MPRQSDAVGRLVNIAQEFAHAAHTCREARERREEAIRGPTAHASTKESITEALREHHVDISRATVQRIITPPRWRLPL
jgi:hypothetical protein